MCVTAGTAFTGPSLPITPPRLARAPASPQRPARRAPAMVSTSRPRGARVTSALLGGLSNQPDDAPTARVKVIIEAPAANRRKIMASNLINAPLDTVWRLLSGYDTLADHIPNLALSELRRHPRKDGIRVEQCGTQSILGFEFRASLTMDMTEVNNTSLEWRAIHFDLVSSRDFKEFEGVWRMERLDDNKTALYYTVSIVPKGLVPVRAIEWRIAEDVPGNLNAVRTECERRRRTSIASSRRQRLASVQTRQAQ